MGKKDTGDLLRFMTPFSAGNKELAMWLREFVWKLYPKTNELIYDNYNALAIGWSLSEKLGDTFCSIAIFGKPYVHFGFYRGSQIPDPLKMLEGKGSLYRYIKVFYKKDFPKAYITELLKAAYDFSLARIKPCSIVTEGKTITKSISAKKRRPV
jgi:hypothetical protein